MSQHFEVVTPFQKTLTPTNSIYRLVGIVVFQLSASLYVPFPLDNIKIFSSVSTMICH